MVSHCKNPDFIRRTETVFNCPDNTIALLLFTFKIDDSIHHVFQNLRSGDRPLFIYMPHHQDRDAFAFGLCNKGFRHRFYLCHTSGRAGNFVLINRLNGIHNNNIRLQALRLRQNFRNIRFRQHIQSVPLNMKPLCPKFNLSARFLTRHIKNLFIQSQGIADLKQQR